MAKVKKATKKAPSKKVTKKITAKKVAKKLVKKAAKKVTKKAIAQPTANVSDTQAIRLQEADILLQRMRDAGISTGKKPRSQTRTGTAQSASKSASVRILIDTDEITVIKRTSQSSSAPSHQNDFSDYGYNTFTPYGYAPHSDYGYITFAPYGYAPHSDYGYNTFAPYGYESFTSAPHASSSTSSDELVTLQIKSGGRVIVQTGPEAQDIAKQAEKQIQKRR